MVRWEGGKRCWGWGSELERWERWKGSEVARSERWKGIEVASWERW